MFQIVSERLPVAGYYKYACMGVEFRYAGAHGEGTGSPLLVFRKLPCCFKDDIVPRIAIPSVVANTYKALGSENRQ